MIWRMLFRAGAERRYIANADRGIWRAAFLSLLEEAPVCPLVHRGEVVLKKSLSALQRVFSKGFSRQLVRSPSDVRTLVAWCERC